MDIVFMIDVSGTTAQYNVSLQIVRQVVYGLDVTNGQVQVGVVTYSTAVNDYIYLNKYMRDREKLLTAINFYLAGGSTNTQAALKYVQDNLFSAANGARSGVPDVCVVISDGYSQVQESSSANAAANLKASGVKILTVGVGDSPNMVELNNLCTAPSSENAFVAPVAGDADVTPTSNAILTKLCSTLALV